MAVAIMTTALNRALPPPNNWQDFESLCFDLYSRMWKTNDAEMHGRRGQPQGGVDVYGTDRVEQRFVGVQCKGKEEGYGASLTSSEIRAEVAKAKTFDPPLQVFIVATTALNDEPAQKLARRISQEHAQAGLFEVRVQGWNTLRQRITDYPDLVLKHFRDFAPFDVIGTIKASIATTEQEGHVTRAVVEHSRAQIISVITEQFGAADPLQAKIGELSKLIDDGHPAAAITGLERLWAGEGKSASARNRYRLRANMGGARFALDDLAGAVKEFREAHAADPEFAGARAILATAEVIEGNVQRAFELATKALQDDPTSIRAASIIIDTAPRETSVRELSDRIPKELREKLDVILGLSIRARKDGDTATAVEFAQRAYAHDPNDWRTSSILAEALIEPILTTDGIAVTRKIPSAYRDQFSNALKLLRDAWAQLESRGDATRGLHVISNLISMLDLAGLDTEAEAVLTKGLEISPRFPPFLRRYAQKMAQSDDWPSAARALAAIPEENLEPEDQLFQIQTLIQMGVTEAAFLKAKELAARWPNDRHGEVAASMSLEAAAKLDRFKAEFEPLLDAWPKSIVLRSVALNYLDDGDPARPRLLQEIREAVVGINNPRDRLHAAEALYSAKAFSQAADLYEGLHDTDKDSLPLRRHIRSLYFADRRRDARELFDTLADDVRALPDYATLGVAIYDRSGLLADARKLLEDALRRTDNLHGRLQWIGLCHRLDDINAAKEWLLAVDPDVFGSPRDLMSLAVMIDRNLADPQKALPIAYRALRAGYGDPQIHLGYVGLFLMGQTGRSKIDTPTVIAANTAVTLAEKDGAKQFIRVLESEPNPQIERDEVALDDPLSLRLVGLKVGDNLEIETAALGPVLYVVKEIRTKFVYAHFRSLNQFETLFPGNRAFGSFQVDKSKGEDAFKPIFDSVKRRAEFSRQIEDGYRSGSLPISIAAKIAGSSAFDVWEAFRLGPNMEFQTALGVAQEYKDSDQLLHRNCKAVVDPVTLYGLVRLGIADLVHRCFGEVAIVQTALDELREMLAERRDKKGVEQGSLGWDGEHYRMVELSEEVIDEQIADAESVLRFAEKLTLLPAEATSGVHEGAKEIFERLDRAYLDTILAAKGHDWVLLCDDRPFRVLAAEAAGVQGIWTQVAAKFGTERSRITEIDFMEITGVLADAGHVFTMIAPPTFLYELEKSGWSMSARLRTYMRLLAKPTNEPQSVVSFLGELFFSGWLSAHAHKSTNYGVIFEELFREFRLARPDFDLKAMMEAAFVLSGQHLAELAYARGFKVELLKSTALTPIAGIANRIDSAVKRVAQKIATALTQAAHRAIQKT